MHVTKITTIPENEYFDNEDNIELQYAKSLYREFDSTLKNRPDHRLFGITMMTKENYFRTNNWWWDDVKREEILVSAYKRLEHRLSSDCCPNYRRDTHRHKRLFSTQFVEHKSNKYWEFNCQLQRIERKRVSPHTHGLIAIHEDWCKYMKTNSLVTPATSGSFSISEEILRTYSLSDSIKSIQLKGLGKFYRDYDWERYSCKQNRGDNPTALSTGLNGRT